MSTQHTGRDWISVCRYDDIVPNTGVCALVNGRHVAVFRVEQAACRVYAIANFDPASQASVLSRGLVGSLGERVVVASPIYKHHYDLHTGECLEESRYTVDAYATRVLDGDVLVFA